MCNVIRMGQKRHCVEFRQTTSHNRKDGRGSKALRCARMATNPTKAPRSPACDKRLTDGGRSTGLMRKGSCGRRKASRPAASKRA